MEIKDKIIIVTGASEGIGEAAARLLAHEGAKVVLAARSEQKIAALAHELSGSLAVHADMRNREHVTNLIDRTLEVFGRIDILINNAGQGMYGPVENVDIEKYREIIELNVIAPLLAMELAIPHMRSQGGGMILNISSRVSKNYFPGLGAYASTKYALNALSLTAREELKKDNIVVGIMLPKMTATNFGKNAVKAGEFRRPGDGNRQIEVDTAEDVAKKIVEQIRSEEPEASM